MASLVRRDPNHKQVKQALLDAGVRVLDVSHHAGLGCDLIADGNFGGPVFIEIKDGTKPPSARRLTDSEIRLQLLFPGSYFVVLTPEEALRAVGLLA
jgi:hypothetical protein